MQDNPVIISEGESQSGVQQNNTELMLDRLVQMVDGVEGENRSFRTDLHS